jgi:CrcB protein
VILLAVALAGGLGAAARFLLDGVIRARVGSGFPLGTMVVNVTGSFALGLLTGLGLIHAVPDQLRLIAGTGFLGGYTTFSTASVETVRLVQEHRTTAALLQGLGTLLLTAAAAAAGLGLGLHPAGG